MFVILITFLLLHSARSFATHEHIVIGAGAKITVNGKQTLGNEAHLNFPNGNTWITFSSVVALAGDFYGLPDSAISDAVGLDAQMTAFNNSFNTLYHEPASCKIVDDCQFDPGFSPSSLFKFKSHILLHGCEEDIVKEIAIVKKQGKQPSEAYKREGLGCDDRYNVITGGGCKDHKTNHGKYCPINHDLFPAGTYLQLAATNWDHFTYGGRAWSSYVAGHTLALRKAHEAYLNKKIGGGLDYVALSLYAYSLEAFAQHFLTDMFSSGHMRTPRKLFTNKIKKIGLPSTNLNLGSYLSKFQHDEECRFGLNVTNKKGDTWSAYGDQRYLDDVNAASRVIVEECVQASVDEILAVLVNGNFPGGTSPWGGDGTSYSAYQYIPIPLTAKGTNLTPLFNWDSATQDLQRRADINDLWSLKYIGYNGYGFSKWTEYGTCQKLENDYGPPTDLPPMGNGTKVCQRL